MKRVLICGIDGYIGYPLALHLLRKDYEVCGVDNYSRRRLVMSVGSDSLTPIAPPSTRDMYLHDQGKFIDVVASIDLEDYYLISEVLKEYKPDIIVHLAEQPSAPWSMRSPRDCLDTQRGNVLGTLSLLWAMKKHCPDVHLLKLGTMGEYGTPGCDIPEGEIPKHCLSDQVYSNYLVNGPPAELEYIQVKAECPMSTLPFPRSPNSFYHLSKVHDTHNIIFACKTWGLRSTDIMQGVVFGVKPFWSKEDLELTRFDYDEYFGTAINRFCAQAVGDLPLTVYGKGNQTRGFLSLSDSIQCLTIAIENEPKPGEYRVFNQFENTYAIDTLAKVIATHAEKLGIKAEVRHLPNPRTEADKHYYNPMHQKLFDLGYIPSNIDSQIQKLLVDILPYKDRVLTTSILPTTTWK